VEYTSEQLGGFRAEASRRRKKAALAFLAMALPLYGVMFSIAKGQALGIGPFQWVAISLAVSVGAQFFMFSVLRCPACNARLGIKKGSKCPACGVSLA
jgi:hypothetical protein